MRSTVRHPLVLRVLTGLVLMSFVQGCMRWEPVGVQPARLRSGGETVRAQLDSGQLLTLRQAFIARDSLMHAGGKGIPLERVRRIEAQRANGAATGLVIATTVGLVAFVAIVATQFDCCDVGSPMGSGHVVRP